MEGRDAVVTEEVLLHILKLFYLGLGKVISAGVAASNWHRIERAQRKGVAQLGKDTLFHLSSSLLSECDAQDLLQLGISVQKQVQVPGCQHLGLACTGAGRDYDVVISICDC